MEVKCPWCGIKHEAKEKVICEYCGAKFTCDIIYGNVKMIK
jgi:uncharacterized Zn-finger protein